MHNRQAEARAVTFDQMERSGVVSVSLRVAPETVLPCSDVPAVAADQPAAARPAGLPGPSRNGFHSTLDGVTWFESQTDDLLDVTVCVQATVGILCGNNRNRDGPPPA